MSVIQLKIIVKYNKVLNNSYYKELLMIIMEVTITIFITIIRILILICINKNNYSNYYNYNHYLIQISN
jgi:hypothetical protein